MLKGYTTPLTPKGKSSLVPAPPWHNAGIALAIEYWAEPAQVAAFLPDGFEPADDPGHSIAHFMDWQSSTESGEEILDPVAAQYQEFFLLIAAKYGGENVYVCPFMYVDTDINLYRGLLQGLPKQMASIHVTRSYPVSNPAGAPLEPGRRFGASLTLRDRRLADGVMTLTEPGGEPLGLASSKIYGLRHFPDLAGGPDAKPLVYDLVAFTGYDKQISNVWQGEAQLTYYPAPSQELHDLAPLRVGRAARYNIGFSISDIRKVAELQTPPNRS